MTHVLLVGAYGQGNPGDEALCQAFRTSLRHCSLTIATAAPSHASNGVHTVDPTPRAVGAALRGTDVVVVGGGTVFKQLHPSTGRRPNALLRTTVGLIAAARARGAAVALVGVGAGELRGRESKMLARWIVRHSDLLVLRDEESASVLAAAGAAVPFRYRRRPGMGAARWPRTSLSRRPARPGGDGRGQPPRRRRHARRPPGDGTCPAGRRDPDPCPALADRRGRT